MGLCPAACGPLHRAGAADLDSRQLLMPRPPAPHGAGVARVGAALASAGLKWERRAAGWWVRASRLARQRTGWAANETPRPASRLPPREYVKQGAKFAKWRAALKVLKGSCPSDLAVSVNAQQLAEYAAICQARPRLDLI